MKEYVEKKRKEQEEKEKVSLLFITYFINRLRKKKKDLRG